MSACLLSVCGAGGAITQTCAQEAPKPAPAVRQAAVSKPDLRVEYFGAEKGYAVGTENVSILCILRNTGTAPLPANTVRLYCYPLVGLDYTSGELKPVLPELAPGQSVAFRWQLAPSSGQGRLLTSVLVQSNDAAAAPEGVGKGEPTPGGGAAPANGGAPIELPRAVLAAVPHFASQPALGNIRSGTPAGPIAASRSGEVWLANDRVSLHVRAASGEDPVLSLAAKEGLNWRVLANANSLCEVLSSEDGQKAWWKRFRWQETNVRANPTDGVMTLSGSAGPRWGVEFVAVTHRDTGVIDGKIRLTARQTTRLFGVRLPGLLIPTDSPGSGLGRADGRSIALPAEEPVAPEAPRLLAARRGSVTFGLAWASRPPLEGWTTEALSLGNSSLASALGGVWSSQDRGDLVLAGATIEIPFRYFAFAPSETIHDAQRVALP